MTVAHVRFEQGTCPDFDCGASEAGAALTRRVGRTWCWPARYFHGLFRVGQHMWGLIAMLVCLAVVSVIPIVQLAGLGYLLDISGRVARSGRWREALADTPCFARGATIMAGTWLWLLPAQFASSMRTSSWLVDPNSGGTRAWSWGLALAIGIGVGCSAAACFQGGNLHHFLWPRPLHFARQMGRRRTYIEADHRVRCTIKRLRLPHYWWLGARGLAAGVLWLAAPTTLLAAGRWYPLLGVVGGLALAWSVLYVPFLQARLAAEKRWSAALRWRSVRQACDRAPLAFLSAVGLLVLLAIPPYLLKVELLPREAAWLPGVLFVGSVLPARVASGWALYRAEHRAAPRHVVWRWFARSLMILLGLIYAVLVFFSQYLSWYGVASLYEQHALLLPVPFYRF